MRVWVTFEVLLANFMHIPYIAGQELVMLQDLGEKLPDNLVWIISDTRQNLVELFLKSRSKKSSE